MANASKNSAASCCLLTEKGARSSLRTDLLVRRSTFVGSTYSYEPNHEAQNIY